MVLKFKVAIGLKIPKIKFWIVTLLKKKEVSMLDNNV